MHSEGSAEPTFDEGLTAWATSPPHRRCRRRPLQSPPLSRRSEVAAKAIAKMTSQELRRECPRQGQAPAEGENAQGRGIGAALPALGGD